MSKVSYDYDFYTGILDGDIFFEWNDEDWLPSFGVILVVNV